MFRSLKLGLFVFVFIPQTFAYGLITENERSEKLKEIAALNVERSKQAYIAKYYDCINKSKKNVLSIDDLKMLKLTENEAKTVLLYFSAKNFRSCVGDVADKYSVSVNLARYAGVNGYSLKDDPELGKSFSLADQLAVDEMKFTPDYMSINKSKREAIERTETLKQIFYLK